MKSVDTKVNCCALSGFNDFFFNLSANFSHYLFNAGRVDASVGNQLMQCQTGYFATHRVEAGEHDCLRGIVHNDFNSCGSLESADVATFTTNDTSLDLIRVNLKHGHRVFYGCFGGNTLNGLNHNAFGFLVGRQFGLIHYVVDIALSGGLGLIFQVFDEFFLSLFR